MKDTSQSSVEGASVSELGGIYKDRAHDLVQKFYSLLVQNPAEKNPLNEPLVGVLTFPNSGTSWFLRVSRLATNVYTHTVYASEAERANGIANRGVYMLRSKDASHRPPLVNEPALVKSHVWYYDGYKAEEAYWKNPEKYFQQWKQYLPNKASSYIRLVRNPFDNLRARYHLYLYQKKLASQEHVMSFRDWFKQDLPRYMLWHMYCNRLAARERLLTVKYSDLLDNAPAEFARALHFAGFDTDESDVRRALTISPPKYSEKSLVPVHLAYYTEEDINWLACEISKWLDIYATCDARIN